MEETPTQSVADKRLSIISDIDVSDIEALMLAAGVPGLAYAEIHNCELSSQAVYGVEDISTGSPVTDTTVFEAASLTKTLFATLVMQLAEEGLIELDRPIADTFIYPRITNHENYQKLTPRLILSHRSGLPNWASDPTDPETWGDIDFKTRPDTEFGYSGEAYMLLQAYIEAETGETLDQLFSTRLRSLMPNSSLSEPVEGVRLASGHYGENGELQSNPLRSAERAGAAFSANSNAVDYATFLEALCQGQLMVEASREDMLKPITQTVQEEVSWGLGIGVLSRPDGRVHFHWGDNGPFKAFAAVNFETGDGVVFFANAMDGLTLIEPLAEPVLGDLDPIIDWLGYGRIGDAGE